MSDEGTASPLWKQLLGAAVGGGLALALYYGYDAGKPKLLAYMTIPQTQSEPGAINVSDKDDFEVYDRLASRARQIAKQFKSVIPFNANPDDYPVVKHPTEEESEDLPIAHKLLEPTEAPPTVRTLDSTRRIASLYSDAVVEEDVATTPVPITDDWSDDSDVWGEAGEVVHSEAPQLPDSGFPGLIVALGAGMGGAFVRRKKS